MSSDLSHRFLDEEAFWRSNKAAIDEAYEKLSRVTLDAIDRILSADADRPASGSEAPHHESI